MRGGRDSKRRDREEGRDVEREEKERARMVKGNDFRVTYFVKVRE